MAIKSDNFFNFAHEIRTQGTLGGMPVSKEERKEALKKQGTIQFKTFVAKVLNKKKPTVTPRALGGGRQMALPAAQSQRSEVAERVANAFDSRLDDLLKNIREDVGGILAVVDKQVDIDEEEAKDAKNELEKNKRKAK